MKDIIKDRIEKIENNIVPQGYKKTEIGIIPEDWKVEKLRKICFINLEILKNNEKENYYYYDLSSVNNGKVTHPKEKIKFKNLPSRAKRKFYKGDILFSTVRPNLKGFAYIDFQPEKAICSTGFAVLTIKQNALSRFIYYNLFTKKIENRINSLTVGSNYPALNKNDIENLSFPIPPLKEQEKIAGILSTWDQYIENIDSIIESKKKQKKGLMQNLLTGEVRLPGFNGEWKEVKLGDICEITTGNKDNKDNKKDGKYPFYVRSNNILRINEYSYDGEAILIPGDGKIGEIFHYINGKFNFHQRVYKISDFNINVLGKYIYYYLVQFFKREAKKYSAKATVDSLRRETFLNMKINLPPIDEQVAIASVLSSADREIELLEDLRNKRMEEKKGLMQLLLTGIVRVGG